MVPRAGEGADQDRRHKPRGPGPLHGVLADHAQRVGRRHGHGGTGRRRVSDGDHGGAHNAQRVLRRGGGHGGQGANPPKAPSQAPVRGSTSGLTGSTAVFKRPHGARRLQWAQTQMTTAPTQRTQTTPPTGRPRRTGQGSWPRTTRTSRPLPFIFARLAILTRAFLLAPWTLAGRPHASHADGRQDIQSL